MNGAAVLLASIPVVLVVAALPGAAWVLAAKPRNLSRAELVGTSLALSPGLYGGAIVLLMTAGLQLRVATAVALSGFAIAAAVGGLRQLGRPNTETSAPDARLTWITATVVTLAVAMFPLRSEWWRIYSDAWNHLAITRAVIQHGAHPLDPFYAGLPLQYAYIYHAMIASVATTTGASVLALMATWSAFALFGLLLCAGVVAARLDRNAQGWGLVLLLLGLNAAFPLFAPLLAVKAFTGSVRGWPELVRTFGIAPLGVIRVNSFLQSLGGQDYFLNKFMVVTPFAIGLAACMAFAAALLRWLRSGDRRELWIIAGTVLAAGLMHALVLLDLLGATLGLVALTMVVPRSIGLSRRAAAALGIVVVVAAFPAALYTGRLIGGAGGTHREIPIDLSPQKFLGLYSTLALGLLLAIRPARALARESGPGRVWVTWLGLHLAIATVIRTPGPSSFYSIDKFSYLVWIPLALTAAPALRTMVAPRGALARTALLLALFLPVNAIALAGRVWEPHASVHLPWNLPALAWMRTHLPADAVLVVPYGDSDTGNFVGRDQYVIDETLSKVYGYPTAEIAARRALCERLFAVDSLTAGDTARLRSLGRPVYAVWTRFDDPRLKVTPRVDWPGLFGIEVPKRRPHWEGRYAIVYSGDTHVVAELVHAPARIPPARVSGSPLFSR